jgi:hypothetical protein
MIDFLKDCYFNGFVKGRKKVVLTPRYAKKLRAMPHRFSLSNLIENLREFESICKTDLAHESGDPGVQFNEKTEHQKSRETVPFT